MPAAAVIPAPVAYIKVVAVKKLVVGRLSEIVIPTILEICLAAPHGVHSLVVICGPFTLRKLECLRQASARIPQLGIMHSECLGETLRIY